MYALLQCCPRDQGAHVCMYACVRVFFVCTHTHIHAHMHICSHVRNVFTHTNRVRNPPRVQSPRVHACMHVRARAHTHTTHADMYTCTKHICTHKQDERSASGNVMFACICTHTHMHMHIRTHFQSIFAHISRVRDSPRVMPCRHAYAHAHTCTRTN
jgi:hypothetical protein